MGWIGSIRGSQLVSGGRARAGSRFPASTSVIVSKPAEDDIIPPMAHFPHVASTRSPRVSLHRPIPIDFRHEGGMVRGDLHVVSATGGRARTSKPVVTGSVVELMMGTPDGPVRGIVEMLKARQMIHGWVQPFRFLALADDDFDRLKKVIGEH